MSNYCYFNGQILPEDKVRFKTNDLGILRGYSVFDFLRTYNATPVHLDDYLVRFENSVKSFDINFLTDRDTIKEKVEELLFWRADKTVDVGIRLLMTGGYSESGFYAPELPNFLIRIEDLHPIPLARYAEGVKIITHEYQRELPEIKTTNYSRALVIAKAAQIQKATDALYHLDGNISECTRNNFFIFKGNTLVTPKSNILRGVIRKIIIELAKTKFEVEERDIYLEELKEATEAFKTGSNTRIMPVVQIDELKIHKKQVGHNTRALIQMLDEYLHATTHQTI
ncbi:aminotransferase class IV [Microscilla marina]|uniref:branched-chain-amino-acid transaminase n=1 Tax=Microscilla marina ATCC 23134 TaxID=313606 RepID=A1ZIC4_MICM2|nr:aminotransferase class IV [Microscilla marina]EAY29792.1 putative D-alanine aminotransferase-like protein [Microscilla marina ATCC 23134]